MGPFAPRQRIRKDPAYAKLTPMNRLARRLAALVTLFALAFAQLAVSAYACAGQPMTMVQAGETSAPPCHDPGMCERHCDYGAAAGKQVVSAPSVFVAPPLLSLPWRIEAAQLLVPARAFARPFERSIERPPLIRSTVLRI